MIPSSRVHLLKDVPLSNNYSNQLKFKSSAAQQSYFNSKIKYNISDVNFVRVELGEINLEFNYYNVLDVNYIAFQNTDFGGKWFYAFVTSIEYLNENVVKINYELDSYQTWQFEMNFKPSFVEREHCKQYENGLPVVNTLDEGLHYGDMYDTVAVDEYEHVPGVFFLVIVCKKAVHQEEATVYDKVKPWVNGVIQPLTFYINPFRYTGDPPPVLIDGNPMDASPVQKVLEHLYTDEKMVNNIVSLYITKNPGINVSGDRTGIRLFSLDIKRVPLGDPLKDPYSYNVHSLPGYSISSFNNYKKNKYEGFRSVKESKLLMYPYALTILDDFKGNRIEIKNEYIEGAELEIQPMGSLGVTNKIAYKPLRYNTSVNHTQSQLEHALIDNEANDVPIITDMLSAYLQGNKNSIENQKTSIAFNGAMNTVSSGLSIVGSAVGRNPMGVAEGVTSMISGAGNTVLQLQSLNAKQKDISNVPPNITKQGSNTYFDHGHGVVGLFIIKKQIKPEYQKILEDFFNMYGYKVNRVKVPNLSTRSHWNYVKTVNCTITGNIPHDHLQKLMSIFNNGVTLWHTTDIGNYGLDNHE